MMLEKFECPQCGQELNTNDIHIDKTDEALDIQLHCESTTCKGKRVAYTFVRFTEFTPDEKEF